MKRRALSLIIAVMLCISLSVSVFAADFDVMEKTHGTHANPGKTVYSYTENGKTKTKTEAESFSVCPMETFTDLYLDIWCHAGLDFVLTRGYMIGTSDTLFSPDASMTRAMIVTVLYRISKSLGMDVSADGTLPFSDTPAGTWYYDALRWAYKNNVAKGFSADSFAPNQPVTREQITLFVSRFAEFVGDDTSNNGDISKFSDVSTLSAESKKAIAWAVSRGVLNGYENGELRPKNTATRAHFASMLQRWMDGRCTAHNYVLKESKNASCTKDGHKSYACSVCGAEKYVRVPAIGHKYGASVVTKSPTCTLSGKYEKECVNCGHKISGTIPATEHSYGKKQVGKAATCVEEGTYVRKCTKCGAEEVISTIPKTEHKYVEKVLSAATCKEEGLKQKTCSVCGKKLEMSIPITAHKYVDGICTECGRKENTIDKISELSDGDIIVIYNPKSGLCLGKEVIALGLSAVPASAEVNAISREEGAVELKVTISDKGILFTDRVGMYLTCDVTENGGTLCFREGISENAYWKIERSNIINANALVNDKNQYLECHNSFFSCYNMTADTDNYVMEMYKVP